MYLKLAVLLVLAQPCFGQIVFDPQQFYDAPDGLYEPDSLRSLYVDIYEPNYHIMLVDSFWTNADFRLPGDVVLGNDTLHDVGIKYKGNSTFCGPLSWGFPKFPLNLDINHFVGGQKLKGYKKVKLSNAWSDATYVREYVASEIYQKYVPTYEVNLMKVFLEGAYLGLYSNTESINKQFLEKHFGEKDGVLVKGDADLTACIQYTGTPDLVWHGPDSSDYYNHYEMKSDHGWAELQQLIETLRFNPSGLDSILNIDRVLWNFALNSSLLNLDSYNGVFTHNYYLYQTEDGLFQMIPWDLSEAFIGNTLGHIGGDSAGYVMDPYSSGLSRPLLDSLMTEPRYRMQYNAHIRTIIEESLDSALVRAPIDVLQDIAEPAAFADTNKVHDNIAFRATVDSSYNGNSGGILSTLAGRKAWLLAHAEVSLSPPDIAHVSVSGAVVEADIFNGTEVYLMLTTSPHNSRFQSLPMNDSGVDGDQVSGDGIWSTTLPNIPIGTPVKFYIRAQNAEAMRLSPERAEYEFYEFEMTVGVPAFNAEMNPGELISITDLLGRIVEEGASGILFYHYDSGLVRKVLRTR